MRVAGSVFRGSRQTYVPVLLATHSYAQPVQSVSARVLRSRATTTRGRCTGRLCVIIVSVDLRLEPHSHAICVSMHTSACQCDGYGND